ncbi:MAG TPA: hypothetical protein VJ717_12465 [Gemmatimonadaceae bacterium]|nr:hypothetical protein [Gemmatimonadaceae bacterium]
MSNELEASWEHLGALWRTDEHPVVPLSQRLANRVRRQSDRLRVIVVGEIVLTLAMLVGSGAVIVRNGGASAVRSGATVLLYTGAIWAFTLWNRRGLWSPYAESTADFIALLRVRAQRRVRTAWFCLVVISLATIVVFRVLGTTWRVGAATPVDWIWIAWAAYSALLVVWSLWYWYRARQEIRELDAIASELRDRDQA